MIFHIHSILIKKNLTTLKLSSLLKIQWINEKRNEFREQMWVYQYNSQNTPSLKFKCHQKEKDWDQAIGNVLGSQATI